MFSSRRKLETAICAVASTITHTPKFKRHFLERYHAGRIPLREMLIDACNLANVDTQRKPGQRSIFYNMVVRETALMMDLGTLLHKPISKSKFESLVHCLVTEKNKLVHTEGLAEVTLAKATQQNNFCCAKQTTNRSKEKTKMSLQISRPVLIGNTNILTASDDDLVVLIREAKYQIMLDKDVAEDSIKFKAKAKELDEAITLCIAQLDKDAAIVESK